MSRARRSLVDGGVCEAALGLCFCEGLVCVRAAVHATLQLMCWVQTPDNPHALGFSAG